MARLLVAPSVLLALSACLHNVPVAGTPSTDAYGPLEARLHVASFGGTSVTVDLSRPAYVAVFEVVPGSGTAILYPRLGQPGMLDAGRNYPHILAGSLFHNAAGSARDWATRDVHGWRSSSRSWMQPRHIFLVASEMPLNTDALGIWSTRGAGVLTHPAFASFSAQATMGQLLDAILPHQPGAQWTTDVYTIWPEPAPPVIHAQPRTRIPVWLSCGGQNVYFQAGTLIEIIRHQLAAGCRIVQTPPASDSVHTPAPAPDTTAAPAPTGGTKTPPTSPRGPEAHPVRPALPRADVDPRSAVREGDHQPERDALLRALVRAGGRAYRPGDVASERDGVAARDNDDDLRWQIPGRRGGAAGPASRAPRPLPAGAVGATTTPSSDRERGAGVTPREQPGATAARPRPIDRARTQPTRTEPRERELPATSRERPAATERQREPADPPRQAAPRPRPEPAAAPPRTPPPAPVKRAEPPASRPEPPAATRAVPERQAGEVPPA